MLGVDDEGNKFELAPDPMNEELQEQFKDIAAWNCRMAQIYAWCR
ncbi:mannitol dehydrogenase rossman domain family protein [Ruminococcus sp. CAG:60]|nr:mannitol dehydrogenase rossman domain family protein [Ruminococcus sp. CAG:60]